MKCVYTVFFLTANSSFYAARSSLNGVCRRIFHLKGIKSKTFYQGYVISPSGLVVTAVGKVAMSRRYCFRVLLSTFRFFSLVFVLFCFVFSYLFCCFSTNIQLFWERLLEKMCTRQSLKVIWDMINTLFMTLYLSNLLLLLSFSIRKHSSMASCPILSNVFEEQWTQNRP